MSLIGLDIGTTGCKAIVFSADGAILGRASGEYPILTPQPGWAEQDAELVYHLACKCLAQAVAEAKAHNDPPAALALSVQGEAVTPVDKNGKAMRHTILGMDTRTTKENDLLRKRFGGGYGLSGWGDVCGLFISGRALDVD